MKQIIVLVSMVILGIAIAGFVSDFKTNAQAISNATNQTILTVTE